MKKTLFLLMLFIGAATVMTSCKKEDKLTEKQRVFQLLTSGKWYYQTYQNLPHGAISRCFDSTDYFHFHTDSTFTETWDFGNSTYTVAEDGKSIILNLGEGGGKPYSAVLVTITNNSLKFTINWGKGDSSEYSFAKTALDGCP
ncbi:MAG: hypothetical protein RJA25_2649 [Bacteroidota bacterium]|jgi:hypothetical protein